MNIPKIDSIQALRGIAAVAVVARHSWESFRIGSAGVELFFIISGFTMVYASQGAFGSARSIIPFLGRRFIRIYPTYWAATTLMIMLIGAPALPYLLSSLALFPSDHAPILDTAWTLIFEVEFYIIFAACLFLPMRKAVAVVCLLLVALVCLRPIFQNFYFLAYTRPVILEFAAGALIGLAYCEGLRIGRQASLLLIGIGIVALGLSGFLRELEATNWLRQAAWGVPAVLIFVGVVFGPEIRFLKGHVFQELGSASYSIYILHWVIFIGFLLQPHHRPATFFTSLLVGMGFYYTFEKPFLSFVRKKLRAHASTREMASRDLSETSELPGTAVP